MLVKLINGALLVNINFETSDSEYDDNICLCFEEPCLEEEKVFRAEQTNIFLTPKEARNLAKALINAANHSDLASTDSI
jgi:hypothetical protein